MRIFSGIRPTGDLHIGNYLGAIKQWIELQKEHECIFCIVDLHAITTPYKKEDLQKNILETAIIYLAAGVDPEKSIIFVQSSVKEHAELAWLLGTITPVGELSRMTQFKEKSEAHKDYVNLGLFSYPVLMASDILLYGSHAVPVGKDQEQHVELTRTITRKFNQKFGDILKEPKAIVPKEGAKIMSLVNPKKKMSKSDEAKGCISLLESPESITKKIMSSTTDSGKDILYNATKKPGISNLLTIYSLLKNQPIKEIEKQFKGKTYSEFKKSLAEVIIDYLEPFRRKKEEFSGKEEYIKEILHKGSQQANSIASSTIQEIKKSMGL